MRNSLWHTPLAFATSLWLTGIFQLSAGAHQSSTTIQNDFVTILTLFASLTFFSCFIQFLIFIYSLSASQKESREPNYKVQNGKVARNDQNSTGGAQNEEAKYQNEGGEIPWSGSNRFFIFVAWKEIAK